MTTQSDDSYPDTFDRYLNTFESVRAETWIITIKINNQLVLVKVDTGAEVTTLYLTWKSLNIVTPLEKAEIALFGPDQRQLNVRLSLSLIKDDPAARTYPLGLPN